MCGRRVCEEGKCGGRVWEEGVWEEGVWGEHGREKGVWEEGVWEGGKEGYKRRVNVRGGERENVGEG